jgi:hypothetical protein
MNPEPEEIYCRACKVKRMSDMFIVKNGRKLKSCKICIEQNKKRHKKWVGPRNIVIMKKGSKKPILPLATEYDVWEIESKAELKNLFEIEFDKGRRAVSVLFTKTLPTDMPKKSLKSIVLDASDEFMDEDDVQFVYVSSKVQCSEI